MREIGKLLLVICLLIFYAAQFAALDLIWGKLMGVNDGVLQLYDWWFAFVRNTTLYFNGSEELARWIAGIWALLALGVGLVQIIRAFWR
jgi:hypothetical protein